ncbi:MAG: helix-turn-helix domain-containing protein, partial [Gemmatimonadales bacterium]
ELTVNVRLITATNRDLAAAAASNAFREDLFYRLNVLPIYLPPIRERSREDRLALLTHVLGDLRARMPGAATGVTDEALERLLAAPWPGNVREMRNVLERAMLMSRGAGTIGLEHLPPDLRLRSGGGGDRRRYLAQTLEQVERTHIERTLQFHGGNRTRAAKELGISRATLINKIKTYGLNL